MFRSISYKVNNRQSDIIKKNSKQEVLEKVIANFLKESIGIKKGNVDFKVKIEHGNLYLSLPSKSLTNEIIFKARSLYAALKQNRIVCNNLVVR